MITDKKRIINKHKSTKLDYLLFFTTSNNLITHSFKKPYFPIYKKVAPFLFNVLIDVTKAYTSIYEWYLEMRKEQFFEIFGIEIDTYCQLSTAKQKELAFWYMERLQIAYSDCSIKSNSDFVEYLR